MIWDALHTFFSKLLEVLAENTAAKIVALVIGLFSSGLLGRFYQLVKFNARVSSRSIPSLFWGVLSQLHKNKKKEYAFLEGTWSEYRLEKDPDPHKKEKSCWIRSGVKLKIQGEYYIEGSYNFNKGPLFDKEYRYSSYELTGWLHHGTLTFSGTMGKDTTRLISGVYPHLDDRMNACVAGILINDIGSDLISSISILSFSEQLLNHVELATILENLKKRNKHFKQNIAIDLYPDEDPYT